MLEQKETTKRLRRSGIASVLGIGFFFFLFSVRNHLDPWILMWILAGAQWWVFKLMRFFSAGGSKRLRLLFFLWIGMDTAPFLRKRDAYTNYGEIFKPHPFALPASFLSVSAGASFICFFIPRLENPLIGGWLGMLAILFLLHYGSFYLLARIFHWFGFSLTPIMLEPWKARDLSDFWGQRWNRAFSDWAGEFVFRPLAKRLGIVKGTLAGFLVSGLAHEFTISLPANAGYGLPTLYFLIQGVALLLFRKLKLPPLPGRLATFLCVLLPAPLLFHPPFLERVIYPMIKTML